MRDDNTEYGELIFTEGLKTDVISEETPDAGVTIDGCLIKDGATCGMAADFAMWCPDCPPVSPSAYDDEFDDASFDAVLWSEFDPGGFLTVSENETGLILDMASDPGWDLAGIYQSIPAGDFCITTRVAITHLAADWYEIGLSLWEDATNVNSDLVIWILSGGASVQNIHIYRFTNYQTFSGQTYYTISDALFVNSVYLRIRRVSTTYYYDWSNDGLGWRQVYGGTIPFTPGHFGITINNYGQGVTIQGMSTFFRYTNSGVLNQILQGDRIDGWRT